MVKTKLPNHIVLIPNKDKEFHEKPKKDDLGHMAHPSRIIACGPCNTGKSLIFLNLAMHADPIFDRIVIFHNDGESEEYSDIDAEYVDEVPTIDFFDKNQKSLLIFEDINFKDMKRDQMALVDRYYGCWSTHHNISVWATFQDHSPVLLGLDGWLTLLYYGIMEMLILCLSYRVKLVYQAKT